MDYGALYNKMTAALRRRDGLVRLIRRLDRMLKLMLYLLYPALLLWLLYRKDVRVLPVFLIPAISFVLLSLLRHLINRPRPYVQWSEMEPLIRRNKTGDSMPSRHVFSCVVIAMAWLYVVPVVGWILIIVGVLIAFIRVAAGVHYPSDVIVGYLCGLLAGLLFFIL